MAKLLSGGSGEKPTSKLIQGIDRIQILVVVGLKPLFPEVTGCQQKVPLFS